MHITLTADNSVSANAFSFFSFNNAFLWSLDNLFCSVIDFALSSNSFAFFGSIFTYVRELRYLAEHFNESKSMNKILTDFENCQVITQGIALSKGHNITSSLSYIPWEITSANSWNVLIGTRTRHHLSLYTFKAWRSCFKDYFMKGICSLYIIWQLYII